MRRDELERMVRGWFVGDFEPSVFRTSDVEVAVKKYLAGEREERHYHRIATEITVVVSGRVRMDGVDFGSGEIVVVEPGESTNFEALTDAVNVVVKLPGARDDKFPGEPVRA